MSIKFSNVTDPVTQISFPASEHTTLPNADWTIGVVVVWDGNVDSTENSHVISSGQTTGSFGLVAKPSNRIFNVFIDGSATARAAIQVALDPGKAYLLIATRMSNVLRTKMCPILTTNPIDGSAVITNPTSTNFSLTKELPGGATNDVRIGVRPPGDRRWDNSTTRAFMMHGTLTDLEIAKLAYGMDIYEIGKTPKWYIRMNDGSDTADFGPNKLVTTSAPTPMATGANPGFGYVSVNSPPTVTKPSIPGSPQVGTTVTATSGTVGGYPNPTNSWQWLRNGAAIAGATSQDYIPVAEDVGTNTLSVRQIVTSSQGTANATSDPVSVAASANTVNVVMPTAERIFQRSGTSLAIPFAGTYTGTQPASIEYQLYDPDGTTVRKAWASIGANIVAGGTWSATPSIPQGAKKYRMQIRTKTSGGAVIATSALSTERFGVGDLILFVGSSTAQTWARKTTGNADNDIYSSFSTDGWGIRPEQTLASKMAARITAATGVVVACLTFGASGTSLTGSQGWLNKSYSHWLRLVDGLNAVGNKIAGAFVAVGSNDAGAIALESKAVWVTQIQTFVQNIRELAQVPNLRFLWSGLNQRTTGAMAENPAVFDSTCNFIRMAELEVMLTDPYFVLSPSLHFPLGDGVHLTDAGYDMQTDQIPYVWNESVAGRVPRGPRITSMTYQGNRMRWGLTHGNGTNLLPFVDPTGIAAYAADNTPLTFTAEKYSPTAIDLVCSGNVTRATYMAGRAPDNTRFVYDNGATPLPMFPEMERAAVAGTLEGTPPPQDTTAPVMVGSIAITNVAETGATLSWQAATDDTAVVGYEYSINGGTSYTDVGTSRTAAVSGLSPSTAYPLRVRAYDAAGNRAAPLTGTLTTASPPADTTAPVLAGTVSATNVTGSTATIAWPAATDNVAVTGYEYSINGGNSYTNAGTARIANLAMLAANTTYALRVRAYDAAGNKSGPIQGSFSTTAAPVTPADFVPSVSRSVRILPGRNAFDVGAFWTANGANSPLGSKDPNSTIDIYFDWTAWLADIGNAKLSAVDFILSPGAVSVAGIPNDTGGTVFVSGGTAGQNISITCRITTATVPARIEDRTVILQIKEQ